MAESVDQWIKERVGMLPKTSLGWFRSGVGFFNKKHYVFAIECLEKAVELDPLNFNAYQVMARAHCRQPTRRRD